MKFSIFNFKSLNIVLMAIAIFSLLPFNFTHADYLPIVQCGLKSQDNPATPQIEGACTTCDVFATAKRMIDFGIYVFTPAIATAFFIYAGFLMLLSGANPGLFNKAKTIFTGTIYGVIIVLTAWLITNTFIQTFGPANVSGSWWAFVCPAGLP